MPRHSLIHDGTTKLGWVLIGGIYMYSLRVVESRQVKTKILTLITGMGDYESMGNYQNKYGMTCSCFSINP